MKNAWITFGVSYSGALSAWYREKYPHLTRGALSSSGVVEAILNFYQFDAHIAKVVGTTCADAIRNVSISIQNALHSPQRQYTKSLFKAENMHDLDFLYLIADSSALAVQYGHQQFLCQFLAQPGDVIKNYANYCKTFFYVTFDSNPNDYDLTTIMNEDVNPRLPVRQWWYQTCSELAYFNTAPPHNSLRSSYLNITYFKSRCESAFGANVWPNVDETNWNYGGKDFAGSNVYFTNGSQDPWIEASIIRTHKKSSNNAFVIECQNCGHGVDVRGCPQIPTPARGDATKCLNLQPVLQARANIAREIGFWLES